MEREELIERFPRLFHVTEAGAWGSIRRHGLLSTSALLDLFEIGEPLRSQIEARPRPQSVLLEHPRAGRAVIRDNRPLRLDILERCLDGGVSEWCRLLNARVFFWATERRLLNHLRARGHRGHTREVVVVDTRRLLEREPDSVTLCAFNSGSALYPNAPRRGAGSFVSVDAYPFDAWRAKRGSGDALAEVCVDGVLTDVEEVAVSVTAVAPDGRRRTIWSPGARSP